MAIKAVVETVHGEERELYIRLNNVEASNHGVEATAKFRGYISQEKFEAGANYLWEQDIEFVADVTQPLWGQAYQALKSALNVDADTIEDC
ncbi:MAG: hypothetical protein ACRCXB_29125 [Aeromonadaceae bacterium]